jgi:phosphoglycerate kinase
VQQLTDNTTNMIKISDYNFHGKKALVRVDFNVPLTPNNTIADDTKITSTIPTINKILLDEGAAIIISHLGRPQSTYEEALSLKHIVPRLNELLGNKVKFCPDILGNEALTEVNNLQAGQILLLENLRFNPGEKNCDNTFAKFLSELADVYVNDAFGTIHRQHASNFTITQYFKDKMMGYLMEKEISQANKIIKSPTKPFTLIIGGNKIDDKAPLIQRLLPVTDNILLGSSMVKFFQQPNKITNTTTPEQKLAHTLLKEITQRKINLYLPIDLRTSTNQPTSNEEYEICEYENIRPGNIPVDIGPSTQRLFDRVIMDSKTILWNGPMGIFEVEPFGGGTLSVANSVAESTKNGAFSLVGGGDSVAAIKKSNLVDNFSHVSTGGGAMLYYLSTTNIPTLNALK